MKKIALFVFLTSISVLSHAAYYSGNELKQWADASDRMESEKTPSQLDILSAGAYTGIVAGVHDAYEPLKVFCTPSEAKLGQILAVVKKYVKANPEKWDKPAALLVTEALTNSFPCKK